MISVKNWTNWYIVCQEKIWFAKIFFFKFSVQWFWPVFPKIFIVNMVRSGWNFVYLYNFLRSFSWYIVCTLFLKKNFFEKHRTEKLKKVRCFSTFIDTFLPEILLQSKKKIFQPIGGSPLFSLWVHFFDRFCYKKVFLVNFFVCTNFDPVESFKSKISSIRWIVLEIWTDLDDGSHKIFQFLIFK